MDARVQQWGDKPCYSHPESLCRDRIWGNCQESSLAIASEENIRATRWSRGILGVISSGLRFKDFCLCPMPLSAGKLNDY